jgi:haloacetate dehalogenase
MNGLIAGFEQRRLAGAGVEIDTLIGGSGPALLLLHGYPQTRMIWKAMAPLLARQFTLVIPDLRGYGRSEKPAGGPAAGDPEHQCYSKRMMASDQIQVMRALGFDRFAVAGHDRGGRVAYRLALDHPDEVSHLAVFDIMPTAEMWASATAESAMQAYHWYMLAQPQPLPETLLAANAEFFLRWTLANWAAPGFSFDAECLADYLACFSNPASIHASCEDYRAGWTIDRANDEADRGNNLIKAPLLALWGAKGSIASRNAVETWKNWAYNVQGHAVPGGHFVPEEAPAEAAQALIKFMAA